MPCVVVRGSLTLEAQLQRRQWRDVGERAGFDEHRDEYPTSRR
jgi:hypothetical protein